MQEVITFQLSVKWYGEHRLSPEYNSVEEAIENIKPFAKRFEGKYLNVTIVRNVRYVAKPEGNAQ